MIPVKFDAFISYSRSDFQFAEKIARKLQEQGLDIFFDEVSILYGQNIPLAIESAIASSLKIIFIVSSESLSSQWVSFERKLDWEEIYLKNHNKVIPLLIEDCQLPKDINKMRYIDFTNEDLYEQNFDSLIAALRSIVIYETGQLEIKNKLSENEYFFDLIASKMNFYFGLFPQDKLDSFRLVIGELVSNAIQHPKPKAKASIEAKLGENIIEIYVRDSGQGFDLSKTIDEQLIMLQDDAQVRSGRGLILASRNTDSIDNFIEDGMHVVRAVFLREKPYAQVQTYEEYLRHPGAQATVSARVVSYLSSSEKLVYTKVIGDVDCYSDKILMHIFRNNADPRVKNYIFDLHKVNFIDSSGLALLVDTVKYYLRVISVFVGDRVKVAMVVNARGNQTIRLVRLEEFLNIFPTLEEAKEYIADSRES
jgi:anti-anti-sigma factor